MALPAVRVVVRPAFALLIVAAVMLAGCRGGKAPASVSAQPSGQTPVPGLAANPASVTAPGLRSYRYLLAVDVSNVSGVPAPSTPAGMTPNRIMIYLDGEVSGDRQWMRMRADLGVATIDNERIQIGRQTWSRQGAAAWIEEPPGSARASAAFGLDTAATALLGTGLDGGGPARTRRVLGNLQPTPDRVGNIEALRYLLDAREIAEILGNASGDSPLGSYQGQAQFWVTKEGALPLRLVLAGGGPGSAGQLQLQLDVLDQNSNEIAILPPA